MTRAIMIMAMLLAACGDQGVVAQMCERADECNALPSSSSECVEYIDRCVDQLTPSEREEWEYLIQECLERPTCGGAFDCYAQVPWC